MLAVGGRRSRPGRSWCAALVVLALVASACVGSSSGNGPMVISNQGDSVVYLRVVGPTGLKEDFEVASGTRRDLVSGLESVRYLVGYDAACSESLLMDFDVADRPFAAGGLITYKGAAFVDFVPGPQTSVGIKAEPSMQCTKVPTPIVDPSNAPG